MMPAADVVVASEGAPGEVSGSSHSDCTDCAHCASRSKRRTRAGVRVSVNLQQFFSDHRALAFMWAPYGRCVQWLSRRVARVFGLPDDIALVSRGRILPIHEPLIMLDRDDPIEVVKIFHVFNPHGERTTSAVSSRETAGRPSAVTCGAGTHLRQTRSPRLWDTKPSEFENVPEATPLDVESKTRSLEDRSTDENEDLQRIKRQALRLLDRHCHMLHDASAPKRIRRRRRRRKLPSEGHVHDVSEHEGPCEPDRSDDRPPEDAGTAVMRNTSGVRPPRLVRALSPVVQHTL